MATFDTNRRLAAALEALRLLQSDGARVFASGQLARGVRQLLLRHGFLQEVMKGWLVSSSPAAQPGDTTPWYSSFWEFCRRYCEERFGADWHLSPEQSLLIHAADTVIPKDVILYSAAAHNNRIELAFGTSFFALAEKTPPPAEDVELVNGLRIFRVDAALVRVPAAFFAMSPIEAQVVLAGLRDPSAVLARLLRGQHPVVAGRLAGAFRRVGRAAIADEITATMRAAGHEIRETDPFANERVVEAAARAASPIVLRLQTLWATQREVVLAELPPPPRRPTARAYLRAVDDVYRLDAYHSLSIEGYQVTPALIARVEAGQWDPGVDAGDRATSDALAARGYWQAFQRVRETVRRLLVDKRGVDILRSAHREWYRELFAPHVASGLLDRALLAGYRTQPVYLRGSRHVPPRAEVLSEAMGALMDLVEREPSAAVRAVLGHWLLGYVHPFPDGNGRVARFLMNALFAAGGYPWTVIRVEDRDAYLAALETASVDCDARPFARFVAKQMKKRSSKR